jgi:hypothetical protein
MDKMGIPNYYLLTANYLIKIHHMVAKEIQNKE